ncbi:MAG: DUF1015 domain-containing protein [Acholeplasmataceae bacterium]|nr:DUF1015 domain-containing protein [Acholeplasmataceae bacterium]
MRLKEKPIVVKDILLPNDKINYEKWSVVACDQFTSQPEYWEHLKNLIGIEPSTYDMILPEVYLEKMSDDTIKFINMNMHHFINTGVFKNLGPSMILVERKTLDQKTRLGLMLSIDLETYDFNLSTKPLIRSTEHTILSRIPPRVHIRKHAPLELTHVMLLANDDKLNILENLFAKKDDLNIVYDFDLNMNGGHIRGYQITDCKPIINDFYSLITDPKDPILFIVGDGNHSLATAKTHWEEVKVNLSKKEIKNHPARFALVEVVNIYDKGLDFEGIHRVLFNVDKSFIKELQDAIDQDVESWIYTKEDGKIPFYVPKSTALAYEQIQSFIDNYLTYHADSMIDYIHGDDELISICDKHQNSIGIHMPILAKKDLFPFVQMGKVLPRKSFSMGSATAKRYYLESRFIKNINFKEKRRKI